MHVHAHHQQNRQTHFLSVFSLWSTTARRFQQTERPPAPEGLWIQNVRGTDTMKENMKGKVDKVGNIRRWRRTMKEKNGSVDSRTEGFGLRRERVRDTQEKPVNMWYSNMAFSNVKHKKQSCRTCRTSVTQTFVSLYGFSVMYPPLGKERLWTLSFVTGFFLFLSLCFYFFNSRFWLYSIWCTLYIYGDALCTVHCTIFCVMSGLSPLGQPHFLTNYSPPLQTHPNTHNICTQTLKIHITATDGCQRVATVKHWIWIG